MNDDGSIAGRFSPDESLVPTPLGELIDELRRFDSLEDRIGSVDIEDRRGLVVEKVTAVALVNLHFLLLAPKGRCATGLSRWDSPRSARGVTVALRPQAPIGGGPSASRSLLAVFRPGVISPVRWPDGWPVGGSDLMTLLEGRLLHCSGDSARGPSDFECKVRVLFRDLQRFLVLNREVAL